MSSIDWAPIIAIFSGCAGIVSAVGGILLAVRAIRNKERKAAKEEIDELSKELTVERHQRLSLETQVFKIKLWFRRHGLSPPELEDNDNVIDIPEIESGDGNEPHQLGS